MSDDQEQKRIRNLINSEGDTHVTPSAQTPRADRPIPSRPLLDKNDMPLPRRVNQTDIEGTRVTPAAFEPTSQHRNGGRKKVKKGSGNFLSGFGCVIQILIALLFVLLVAVLAAVSLGVYEYYSIASSLPSVSDLQQHTSQFD